MSDNILDDTSENLLEMSPDPGLVPQSRRLEGLALAMLVVGGIVYGALRDEDGVLHVFRQRTRLQELNRSVEELRNQNQALRFEIQSLREDPRAVEKLAREDLGLFKDDEIVFLLEGDSSDKAR